MTKEKLKKYKSLIAIIEKEQALNIQLLAQNIIETDQLQKQRTRALDLMDFYSTIAFSSTGYTREKRDALLNIIIKATQNGFEFPINENQAINIAAENAKKEKELKNKIEEIQDDITELEIEQQTLQLFKTSAQQKIKTMTK